MGKRTSEVIVGAFVLIAFIIFVIITINLKPLFFLTNTYELYVEFKQVSGLEVGAPVHVYGVVAGEVKGIEYIPGPEPVQVILSMNKDIKIYENAVVRIVTAGLIGETKIEIDAGTPDNPEVGAGAHIKGAELVDLYQALSLAPQIVEDLSVTIQTVRNLIAEEKTQEAVLETVKRLSSLSVKMDDLVTTTSTDIRAVAEYLRESAEKMTQLITETQGAVNDLRQGVQDTRSMLQEGINTLSAELENTGEKIDRAARELEQSSSKVNTLLGDNMDGINQSLKDIQIAVGNLREISEKIESGQGSAGMFVNDPALYQDLRDSVARLKGLLAGFSAKYPEGSFRYEQPSP